MTIYRFSKWRPFATSWILEIFIFDQVMFIQFKICCCCVQNLMKIRRFSLRYGAISIFKTAAVRRLGIVLYHHTRPPTKSVAGRSCLSNFMSIWYTDLKNFSHLWLEMPIQAPKMGFGGLWTPKFDHSSSRPPKGTSLHNSASFKLSTVKIRWGVWPEGELTESVMDIHTHAQVNLYSFHALHSIGQTMIPFVFLVPRWWH